MELIERVGVFLGLAAFLGLAVLVLLYFQQARDVRRLRDWAGRAPERAAAAAEQVAQPAAGQASEADQAAPAAEKLPLRDRLLARLPQRLGGLPERLGERLPERRYLAVIAAGVLLVAAGVAVAVFDVLGGGEEGRGGKGAIPPAKIEVSVLNGTAVAGSPGVPGLAERVSKDVKGAGYELGAVSDTETTFAESVVMYEPGHEPEARRVAGDLSKPLGQTPVQKMTAEVRDRVDGASVALIVGQDDA